MATIIQGLEHVCGRTIRLVFRERLREVDTTSRATADRNHQRRSNSLNSTQTASVPGFLNKAFELGDGIHASLRSNAQSVQGSRYRGS